MAVMASQCRQRELLKSGEGPAFFKVAKRTISMGAAAEWRARRETASQHAAQAVVGKQNH